jgi:hypothetical protein
MPDPSLRRDAGKPAGRLIPPRARGQVNFSRNLVINDLLGMGLPAGLNWGELS